MVLQNICNIIILIGSVFVAIRTIFKAVGKPIVFFKKQAREADEKRTEAITQNVVKQIDEKLAPKFTEIIEQNNEQERLISILQQSSKDLLRKEIIQIYNDNKKIRILTETTRELLEDLYKDYKAEHGNHYIDKIYHRMIQWAVVPDEDD